jgi:hypothetical protein
MSFPVSLTPSAVQDVFPSIPWYPLDQLVLSDSDTTLLRAAEDNPLEYTLAEQRDAELYTRLLLKIVDQVVELSSTTKQFIPTRLCIEGSLSEHDAFALYKSDSLRVLLHFAISKLTDVIQSLKLRPKSARATMRSIFFPNGIMEDVEPLFRVLFDENSEDFTSSQYILPLCSFSLHCNFQNLLNLSAADNLLDCCAYSIFEFLKYFTHFSFIIE